MTARLCARLAAFKHLRSERVLYSETLDRVTAKVLRKWLVKAQRRAGLRATGALHILRHSFCSRLATRGVPAMAIQALAGHQNMQTTLRYMHLAVGETDRAIHSLELTADEAQAQAAQPLASVLRFPTSARA